MTWTRLALLVAASLLLAGAAARPPRGHLATGRILVTGWPYFPGSIIPLRVSGFAPPYHAVLVGPGRLSNGAYEIGSVESATTALLITGNAAGLGATTIRISPPPPADRALAIVASYNDGLVFHYARNFSVLGVLAMSGAPGAVAVDSSGTIAAPDTDGTSLTRASLEPWSVGTIGGVLTGDDVGIYSARGAIFVTNREAADGSGELTRVDRNGDVTRVATGTTAEGLVIDQRRGIVYVANTNDGTIAAVDARSMHVLRRFRAVDRVFSLELTSDGSTLYAVSNQSTASFLGAEGSVVAFALRPSPRAVARSAPLNFPLGIALDAVARRVFVTEEGLAEVDVLDSRTLRRKRLPLHTCVTPWKPALDAQTHRLYVPCAGSDAIDVFDTRTLQRVRGAPFRTGGYPLSLALWHPSKRTLPRKR